MTRTLGLGLKAIIISVCVNFSLVKCGNSNSNGNSNSPASPGTSASTTQLVQSVYPKSEVISADITTTVEIYFTEAMVASSISDQVLTVANANGSKVAGKVTYQVSGNLFVAVFTPTGALAAGTKYSASLASGVSAISGKTQGQGYNWTFTTTTTPSVPPGQVTPFKPVIYLYPTAPMNISVQLNYQGIFSATYPAYDAKSGGWNVFASVDGTLTNIADGKQYNYLFWEGIDTPGTTYDMSTGFLVPGATAREFLEEKLTTLGLSSRERDEFIVYWYPILQRNQMNVVHFSGSDYTDHAQLIVTPTPDSILRVFMAYKPVSPSFSVPEQVLIPFQRHGFAVVECGGAQVP